VAHGGHVVAPVDGADSQLRVDRVLHRSHNVHARLPEEHHENGRIPERVHVRATVAGPNDRHVPVRVLRVVRTGQSVRERHEH